MKPISIRLAALATLCSAAIAAHGQGDPQTIQRIIDQGKNHSQAWNYLRYLSENIGTRLTGSSNLRRGEQWAMSQFKAMGCTNVHLEKWGEIPVGFDRGPVHVARMLEPYNVEMEFTTPAWTRGTKGIVTAEAIMAPATVEALRANAAMYRGKWVVMPAAAPRTGRPAGAAGGRGGAGGGAATGAAAGGQFQGQGPTVNEELDKLGIAGKIRGSRNELVITSGSWANKTHETDTGPVQVTVRKSDYDRIVRNLDWKRKVVLQIGADNRFVKGPLPQHNVVAEIRGTEKPDEVVIVSGHFDTWDGPGSQGTSDNGTGSAAVLECARILTAAGAKPKRTIRFILWGGEEQGLHGSRAYVQQHAAELDKISAVLVDDGGANYQGGYVILESMKPMFEMAVAPSLAAFPDFPQVLRVVETMPRGGGSDHVPFNGAGVPGFFTIETGKQDYNYVHHTQHDHLKNAYPEYLLQSATNHAIVSYNLACAPTMLPRAPRPSAPAGGGN